MKFFSGNIKKSKIRETKKNSSDPILKPAILTLLKIPPKESAKVSIKTEATKILPEPPDIINEHKIPKGKKTSPSVFLLTP